MAQRPVSNYTYDLRLGRYRDPQGRFLSSAEVRHELDLTLKSIEADVRGLADAYRSKDIPAGVFEAEMRQHIKDVHLVSTALARGGWSQLDAVSYGRVGGVVAREYGYLDRFLRDVRSGAQPTDGLFLGRAAMYVQAGRATYHTVEQQVEQEHGKAQYRNVLADAEHCVDCETETARGWVALGTLLPIGGRACLRNCKCHFEYR